MTTCCDLYLHFGGKWILVPDRQYIGGKVDIQFNYDAYLLCYKDIKDKYINDLGCKDIQHLYHLELGNSLADGLMFVLIEGDEGIRSVMTHVKEGKGTEVHIYPFEVNDIPFYERKTITQTNRYVQSNGDYRMGDETIEIFTQSSATPMLDTLNEIEASQVDENVEILAESRGEWHSVEIREACEGQDDSEGSDDNEDGGDYENCESDEDGDIYNPLANEAVIKRQILNKKFTFELGQTFANAKAFRLAVSKYSIQEGCSLKVIKSDKKRVRYHCQSTCSSKVYAVKDGDAFVVRTFVPSYECNQQYTNPRCNKLFLAEYFKEKIRGKPEYSIKDMKDHVKDVLDLEVKSSMCKRAKKAIIEELDGGYKEEYSCLEAYVNELSTSNPGSTFDLQFSTEGLRIGKRIFRRLYLCFNACKQGWMDGCRPIIGLDGCFLKDICKGQLLVAVGHDAMDQIYPIAWAVVEKETLANWKWFLSHLIEDLKLQNGADVTLMSDMQKGLLSVVSTLLPRAEHRWCARHVFANWRIKFKGLELQKHFWSCAWSTYEEAFKDNLKTMAEVNKKATEYLLKYPPQHWCRAYFTDRCKDSMVDNNMTESFNSWILEQRSRPILRMLEEMRVMTMNRLHENEKKAASWSGDYSPTSMEEFKINHSISKYCRVMFNGEKGYEVTHGIDRHCVILLERKCTCRAWQLSGIPCPHAICAMYHAKIDPVKQIDLYYSKLRYMMTYKYKMQPVRGKIFWRIENFDPIEPPKFTRMPGRPKKKRRRGADEGNAGDRNGTRLSRKGQIQKCSNCGQASHKRTYCKAPQGVKYTHLNGENDNNVQQCHKRKINQGTSSGHPTLIKPTVQVREFGVEVEDENSGNVLLDPENTRDNILVDGVEDIEGLHNPDPVVLFPIPNERQLKQKTIETFKAPTGTRSISFNGNESEVSQPSDLPFQPPKLQWKGKKAMTSRQLLEEKELRIGKTKKKEIHLG